MEGRISDIQWLGDTVFVLTARNSVYRSSDGGISWDPRVKRGIVAMHPTASPNCVFFRGSSENWVTRDKGVSYTLRQTSLRFKDVKPHPTEVE